MAKAAYYSSACVREVGAVVGAGGEEKGR